MNWSWRRCQHMFYNFLFEFGTILEDPSNTSSILELFDHTVGKENLNKDIDDSDWFPIEDGNYYQFAIRHVSFLAYKYKQASFATECPAIKMTEKLHVLKPIHGIIQRK